LVTPVNAEQLRNMAGHFREMAADTRSLSDAIDLCKLATEYETAARGLLERGEASLAMALSLPRMSEAA